MPSPIRLGTISFNVDTRRVHRSPPTDSWAPLAIDGIATFKESRTWDASEEKIDIFVRGVLDTKFIDFSCWQKSMGDTVVVRIAVNPNDDGKWNLTSKNTKLLRQLYLLLDKGWDGDGGRVLDETSEEIGSGMQGLYALIDSPPEPHFRPGDFLGDDEVFVALANYDNPAGVNTLMYKYQIRSVARMLQMESQPEMIVDPRYSPFTDAETGEQYYVDLKTMDIVRHPQRFPLPQGGILCEQMGVGKTLMCLALVLASRQQPTQPPKGVENVSQVYTDVALREYSTQSVAEMREMVGDSHRYVTGTPSLAAMCADLVTLHSPAARHTSPWSLTPATEKLLDDRQCIYYRFNSPPRLTRSAKRGAVFVPERFILAQTTLVIVPQILVAQWLSEAKTHLTEGALRIFTLKDKEKKLPSIHELVRYDIVLLSWEQFSKEGKKDEFAFNYETELLKARWKRIILDEGNNANNLSSNAMLLAKTLSIERRWIVSGTPTKHLKQGTEDAERSFLESEGMQRVDSSRGSTPMLSKGRSGNAWGTTDFSDVDRIGKMLKGFLSSDIFQHDDFVRLVARPLRKGHRGGDKPEYGAVRRIHNIMSATMVKHRPGVINEEVQIPPSTISVRLVPFTHWQKLTYNALTALVVSNVYTSNFEDQDYFLHPRNTEAFNQVVTNLHLACLWFASSTMDLEGAITRNMNFVEDKRPSAATCTAIAEANAHMRRALETSGWEEWMRNEIVSVPYEADMLPLSVIDAWSEAADSQVPVIDSTALQLLRLENEPWVSLADIVRLGWEERAHHPQCQQFLKVMERSEKAWIAGRNVQIVDLEYHREDIKAAADKPKLPSLSRKSQQAKQPQKKERNSEIDKRLEKADRNALLASGAPRPLPSVLQTSTRSAKVNFLVRTVLSAPPTDKFVVFGTYDEIAHVYEAITFTGIRSTFAVQRMSVPTRNRAIQDFANPEVRAIFLELKSAARGLTLTLANRMVFLSPVWNLDTQAQAIKRIHRIGQTRPTQIDILVTEGTFEEDVVRREASMRSALMEQSYARALIEHPRFVQTENDDRPRFPIKLVPLGTELNEQEQEEYARLSAAVEPPSALDTRATTPIVTPGTSEDMLVDPVASSFAGDKRLAAAGIREGLEPYPGDTTLDANRSAERSRPKKRARFAD